MPADRDIHQPDVIAERLELRPALSSTGDVPVFLQQPDPPAPDPAPEPEPQPSPESPPAPTSEPEPAQEPVTPEPKPDPRTTRAREQDARLDRALAVIDRLQTALERATTAPPAAAPEPPAPPPTPPELPPEPRPTRAQFDDPEAYDAALVEWAATNATRKALAEHQARLAEQTAADKKAADDKAAGDRQAEQGKVLWDAHQARRAKFIEAHADYEEVVEKAPDLFLGSRPGSEAVVRACSSIDDGPAVAYWLAQPENRAEHDRVTAMNDPLAVLVEVGKISARLAQPKPVEVSRTPKPITPVSGNAMATGKDPNEMTAEEWARHTGRDKPQFRPFLSSSGQRPH